MENKQSLFDLRDKFSELNINEIDTNHAAYITESKTFKIFNSIAKIIAEDRNGTGFFIKLKLEKINCKWKYFNTKYFLVTCQHVVNKKDVDSTQTIKISYGKKNEEIIKEINLNNNKRIIKCFDSPVDITLIQIIGEDCIPEDKFLIPDYRYKNDGFNYYLNKDLYLAGYPGDKKINEERVVCSGTIKEVKDIEFAHTLDTKGGLSGSPICLIDDGKVIGIHKSGIEKIHINYGTFIGFIINDFEKHKEQSKVSVKDMLFDGQRKISKEEIKDIQNLGVIMCKFFHKVEKYALRVGNIENEKKELFHYYCYDCFCKNSSIEELFIILKKENESFKFSLDEFYSKYGIPPRFDNIGKDLALHFIKLKSFLKNENEKNIFDDIIYVINNNF